MNLLFIFHAVNCLSIATFPSYYDVSQTLFPYRPTVCIRWTITFRIYRLNVASVHYSGRFSQRELGWPARDVEHSSIICCSTCRRSHDFCEYRCFFLFIPVVNKDRWGYHESSVLSIFGHHYCTFYVFFVPHYNVVKPSPYVSGRRWPLIMLSINIFRSRSHVILQTRPNRCSFLLHIVSITVSWCCTVLLISSLVLWSRHIIARIRL